MNYGKFFRLNRSLSKIEEGIAIYDYVDLPAYFTPSVENHLSPKYPISVGISQSSVSFRLHYCSFKIEGQKDSHENYTYYTYDSESLKIGNKDKYKSGDDIKVAHMEEVILELPFVEYSTSTLSDIINDIYITNFPQMIGGSTSTGGRFLEQLIHKRYPKSSEWKSIEEIEKDGDTEALLYGTLREASDDSPSYSTLWLMNLIKDVEGEKEKKRIDLYNEKDGSVVAFLRKLLLDFMFDLKHSDIFQNSANYQQMYSGLMSNFYFSALMHKCEYYYYRKITSQAINEIEDSKIDKEKKKERKSAITLLYANELIKAEDLWINDIMNPLAEMNFEYRCPKNKIIREIFEYYSFTQWPSWFAEPEEEMRRVCFTMRDESGKKHICNADTLIKYLKLKEDEDDRNVQKMIDLKNENREQISKWLLRQYDFNDVLHLHWFKHLNVLFVFVFAIPAILSLFTREKLFGFNTIVCIMCEIGFVVALSLIISCYTSRLNFNKLIKQCKKNIGDWIKRLNYSILWYERHKIDNKIKSSGLLVTRWKSIGRNVVWFSLITILLIAAIHYREHKEIISLVEIDLSTIWIVPIITIIVAPIFLLEKKIHILRLVISSLHLFFPRLVASISLSWITLSMGFDLYVSYFDTNLKPLYISFIIFIVMLFVMYEINRITPHASPLRKFWRSFELMIISYFISLSVGFVIINFLGEKYLERGGYISEYYTQYVENEGDSSINRFIRINGKLGHQNIGSEVKFNYDSINSNCIGYAKMIVMKMDSACSAENDTNHFSKRLTSELKNVYHSTHKDGELKAKNPVAAEINFWGIHIFVLRDFLIMFAFIAMFTGIFIQLIIFGDNKQMTEL